MIINKLINKKKKIEKYNDQIVERQFLFSVFFIYLYEYKRKSKKIKKKKKNDFEERRGHPSWCEDQTVAARARLNKKKLN